MASDEGGVPANLVESTNGNDNRKNSEGGDELNESHDPYFPPVVSLPEVEVPYGRRR